MILATEAAHVNQPAIIRAAEDFARHAVAEAVANGHDRYDELWWSGYTIAYHETPYYQTPAVPPGLTGRDLDAWLDGVEMARIQSEADMDAWAEEFEPKEYEWDLPGGGFTGHHADESECW